MSNKMRKPTAFLFFAIEIAIWFSILDYLIITNSDPVQILLMKISITNLGVAVFNMVGTCVSMTLGWRPWRD